MQSFIERVHKLILKDTFLKMNNTGIEECKTIKQFNDTQRWTLALDVILRSEMTVLLYRQFDDVLYFK